jgi:hypothetical protein
MPSAAWLPVQKKILRYAFLVLQKRFELLKALPLKQVGVPVSISHRSKVFGAPGENRTPGPLVRSQVLFPLSYRRIK